MLKIPYGKSDYSTMIEQGYFYQDRTSYVETLENYDTTYLLYLRPRRFGKSLLISMLHYYYGLEYQKEFTRLFESTYIGKKPTQNANAYLVLRFDFSSIDTSTELGVSDGFLSNVKKGVSAFLARYDMFFSKAETKLILDQKQANEVIKELFIVFL
jgi:AAA+ ATPase superfamily predicted ATPase